MGMQSELDCWMLWIENSMADSAFDMPVIDDFDEFQGGTSAFFFCFLDPQLPDFMIIRS